MSIDYNQWAPGWSIPGDSDRMGLYIADVGRFVPGNAPASFDEDGDTHLIVLKFELSDVEANDTVSVYLDPYSATEPELPGVAVGGLDCALTAMGAGFYGGFEEAAPLTWDEIRVGTEFADVMPPVLSWPPPVSWEDLYDIVMSHMNLNVTGGWAEGDIALADGTPGSDGQVTLGDFRVWKDNPYELGGGLLLIAAVPEPSSLALTLAAAIACLGHVRARRPLASRL